ncbi:hypothetical protein SLS55_002412 [Diplodia seriata]|uniref:Caspase domain-containing protein n=1 Tax=Diplodia seriata TaxID=420778 RepID=A0ABR3CS52_9PEZI
MAPPDANNTNPLALGFHLGLAPAESVHGKHEQARLAFNKFVDARYKDGSSGYSEVGVLLVCWTADDMDVQNEVDMLKQVFDEQFRFYTEVYKIPSQNSAVELRAKMQRWAHQFEGAQKLSIIYYAGHGSQVDGNPTDLAMHGTRQEEKADTFFNSSFQPLNLTDTDCLLVLDCCYAAASFSRAEIGRRKFELLCSVAPNEKAYGPTYANSFTKVLCNALEELLEEHPSQGFSTSELYRKLYHRSGRTKKPFLFDQSSKNFGWIYLRPFYYGPEAKEENIAVELRLEMSRVPAEPEMKELAAHMQYLPLVKRLKFQHLHAPDHILQEFFDDLIRRQRIRPFIRKLRQRVAMRRNRDFGLPDTEEEKRVARDDVIDLYDWGAESELTHPDRPIRRASMPYKKGLSRQSTAVDSNATEDNCIDYEPAQKTVSLAVSLTVFNSPLLKVRRKYAELSPFKRLLEISIAFAPHSEAEEEQQQPEAIGASETNEAAAGEEGDFRSVVRPGQHADGDFAKDSGAPTSSNDFTNHGDIESFQRRDTDTSIFSRFARAMTGLSTKSEDEEVGNSPDDIDYHPAGYPKLAAFINSDENFLMCRRYGLLHTRVMLYRQDELRELEAELLGLDAEDAEQNPQMLNSRARDDRRAGQQRRELILKIDEKLKEYDDCVLRARTMAQLPPVTDRNYKSVSQYVNNNGPVVWAEQDTFTERRQDSVALVDPKEGSWFDAAIEDLLTSLPFPLARLVFSDPAQRRSTRDDKVRLYSKMRVDYFARILIALLAVGLLMAPVVVLFLHEESGGIKIVVVLLFTLFFAGALSVFTKAKRHEVFAATAA